MLYKVDLTFESVDKILNCDLSNDELPITSLLCCCASYEGDVTRNDSQLRFLAQHNLAILEQCYNHSKQCGNNDATLCCAKNRRFEWSRVTSPLMILCKVHCAKLLS